MKKYLVACTLSIAISAPAFSADTYTIDPEYTIPVFEVGHLGFTTQRGRFDKTAGKVVLDFPAKKGSVEFTIFTNSLDMGSRAWTIHVSSEGLFRAYPVVTDTY